MPEYETLDGGDRVESTSGAVREPQTGKPRYDLLPPAPLKRVAELADRGAEKYGEHNWCAGWPTSSYLSSAERHLQQLKAGDTDEDHGAAVIWNVMALMHFEGGPWDDRFDWTPPTSGPEA
jgi:hypothetical protein